MITTAVARLLGSLGFKIAGVAGVAGTLILGFLLITTRIDLGQVKRQNRALDDRINNRDTGLVVQLAQSDTNVATLRIALARTRAELDAKAATDAARLAETSNRLAAAERDRERARRSSGSILATKPTGDTLEAQIRDIDARVLESLK